MDKLSLKWPSSAESLLAQTRRSSAEDGELLRLMLAGTHHLDSWLIEHRILPALRDKELHLLEFTLQVDGQAQLSAKMLPLPDGSALVCTADGLWEALDSREALDELAYLGYRHAPSNRWGNGFRAVLVAGDNEGREVTPSEVAGFWRQTTGKTLPGYAPGVVDHLQALGWSALDKVLKTQGRLGL